MRIKTYIALGTIPDIQQCQHHYQICAEYSGEKIHGPAPKSYQFSARYRSVKRKILNNIKYKERIMQLSVDIIIYEVNVIK